MAACPNCSNPMTLESFDSRLSTKPIEIDTCRTCRLFWFDQYESINLSPRAVLSLFQYIGAATSLPAVPMKSSFNCVRCRVKLDFTRDLQRTTAFTYWRCGQSHGKLISYHQFLREKNFIRTPSPPELAKLRETIRQISCSQCGAPIDLAHDSACSHCGAPIAMIDPDGIARQVKALSDSSAAPDPDAAAGARNTIMGAQIDAMFELERLNRIETRERHVDLVSLGAQAIGAAIGAWLSG